MDTICLRMLHAVVNLCNRFLPTMVFENGTVIEYGINWEDVKAEYLERCGDRQPRP